MAKTRVAILGATGAVGQRFVQLLADHPWFEITALAASERSAGRPFAEVSNWVIPGDPPAWVGEMIVQTRILSLVDPVAVADGLQIADQGVKLSGLKIVAALHDVHGPQPQHVYDQVAKPAQRHRGKGNARGRVFGRIVGIGKAVVSALAV